MVRRRMMLRPVVGIVRGAGAPIKLESLLADAAIPQPMETQIHGFGTFWLHPFVDDAFGGGIVNLNGGGRLSAVDDITPLMISATSAVRREKYIF